MFRVGSHNETTRGDCSVIQTQICLLVQVRSISVSRWFSNFLAQLQTGSEQLSEPISSAGKHYEDVSILETPTSPVHPVHPSTQDNISNEQRHPY